MSKQNETIPPPPKLIRSHKIFCVLTNPYHIGYTSNPKIIKYGICDLCINGVLKSS